MKYKKGDLVNVFWKRERKVGKICFVDADDKSLPYLVVGQDFWYWYADDDIVGLSPKEIKELKMELEYKVGDNVEAFLDGEVHVGVIDSVDNNDEDCPYYHFLGGRYSTWIPANMIVRKFGEPLPVQPQPPEQLHELVGKVVQIKSGSPRMTVYEVTGDICSMVYFDEDAIRYLHDCPIEALEVIR